MPETRGGRQRIPRPSMVREGAAAPWSGLVPSAREISVALVRERLAGYVPPAPPPLSDRRPAAVLLPLFDERGEARIVLTKRPETMPSHQGQVAFPGGKVDPGSDADATAAALREAHEEIGLDPTSVEVIGALPTLATVEGAFAIEPFVGAIAQRPALVAHQREVARIFDVALADLLVDGVYREELWWMPASPRGADLPATESADEVSVQSVYFYEIANETIWGVTAHILTALLVHVLGLGEHSSGIPREVPH